MTWPESSRPEASSEEAALRAELRALLAMDEPAPRRVEPTEADRQRADEVLREATHRRHVVPLRTRRPAWVLMAAAIPLLVGLTAVTTYSLHQRRKAEEMAATLRRQEDENRRLREIHAEALRREAAVREEMQQMASGKKAPATRQGPKELVLPAKPTAEPQLPENLSVRNPR